jgi:hypothetical protein
VTRMKKTALASAAGAATEAAQCAASAAALVAIRCSVVAVIALSLALCSGLSRFDYNRGTQRCQADEWVRSGLELRRFGGHLMSYYISPIARDRAAFFQFSYIFG